MKIEIVWNSIPVLDIARLKGMYFTSVISSNISRAIEDGMPVSCISSINMVSKKLPYFIEERIPTKKYRDRSLDVVSKDEGSNILRYIEITKCKCATDKFEVHLT
jgi:uncharacterized protein (DUF2384 family)